MPLARTLADQPGEAEVRTAIGRAYYAVFLRARDHLARIGLVRISQDAGEHGRVISAPREHRRRTAGELLGDLRGLRTTADYDVSAIVSPEDGQRALRLAERIVGLLQSDWNQTPR